MLSLQLTADFITKFLKFGLVGLSGVAVDFTLTYLCKEKLRLHKYLANSIGFITATCSNYLLNRYWTFVAPGQEARLLEFSKFLGIALIGLAINNMILFLFNDKLKFNFYLSKVFAIGVVSIWNFLGNYIYTFAAQA